MNTNTHICAWCNPGVPGNHGICEKHRAKLLSEYGLADAEQVARTFKDLRVERNEDLDSFAARLESENIGWRTFLTFVGIGITAAAAAVGLVLLMTL